MHTSSTHTGSLKDLVKKAVDKRARLFGNSETDCFRIFNSGADGIDGLAMDIYRDYVLIQYFREGIISILEDSGKRKELLSPLEKLPIEIKGILVKNRMKGDVDSIQGQRKSVVMEGAAPHMDFCVRQNGVLAAVDLINGQNTGIFLDMRSVREDLKAFYLENGVRDILNLFSYTGIFSIHALKNGAGSCINIDTSKTVLTRARKNYSLNGQAQDDRDFICGDSMKWIKIFTKKGNSFHFTIFDPPTFSRNKKKTFSIKKDYMKSLELLVAIARDGYALTSVNSLSVSRDEYLSWHPRGWRLIAFHNESSDFLSDGEPYLKVGLWECR